jgi:hypothetical protein
LLEVDVRDRDQLVVERDREVLVECLPEAADEVSAEGDVRGDVLELALALAAEPERDVRRWQPGGCSIARRSRRRDSIRELGIC